MTNPQQLLQVWITFKQKLISTLTELKANHKDKWAVVKSKSSPKLARITLSYYDELNELKRRIAEREELIRKMNKRSRRWLLSLEQQLLLDQAVKELKVFQKQLEQHQRTIITQIEPKPNINEANEYFQQLKELHEKHNRLNDKLNWLRTLVRAGDINQLQELVRNAKI